MSDVRSLKILCDILIQAYCADLVNTSICGPRNVLQQTIIPPDALPDLPSDFCGSISK